MSQRHNLIPTLLAFVLGVLSSGTGVGETFEVGRQNPILRSHFRRQCLEARSQVDAFGRLHYRGTLHLLRKHVDLRIDDFLTQVRKKLNELKIQFAEVHRARAETMGFEPGSVGRRKARGQWRRSLEDIADQANDLRKKLSYVLNGLDTKSSFVPVIEKGAAKSEFQAEISFVAEQIAKAEHRIVSYFFLPTHTVSMEDLKGNTMMVCLYRVHKMSKKLSDELRSGPGES